MNSPDEPAPAEPVSVPAVVVAPADANVAFAVEVKGPVIISKDPNFAVPPPRETRRNASAAPTGPRRFDAGKGRVPDVSHQNLPIPGKHKSVEKLDQGSIWLRLMSPVESRN